MAGNDTRRVNHGRGHSYRLDGVKIDGVTTVINNGLPKPALVGWAAGSVGEFVADRLQLNGDHVLADDLIEGLRKVAIANKKPLKSTLSRVQLAEVMKGLPYAERDSAGNRGTEVHTLAQRLAEGEEVEAPEELVGHVDAYLRWRDEWGPVDELVEVPVFSRTHKYGGTCDLLCRLEHAPDLGYCLIDLKTNRSGPFGDTALQLAAYRYAEFYLDPAGVEKPMPAIDSVLVLWLRADGYDLFPFDAGLSEHRSFLYVQQVAHFAEGARDLKGEALRAPVHA